METRTSQQGDTLDSITFRHYGSNAMLSRVIEANPELAAKGIILDEGSEVKLPPRVLARRETRIW